MNSIGGAELLVYGCFVASGETGNTFLQRLHQITGANIAASNQLVGNAASGGNWKLESRIGKITSGLAFVPEVTQAYAGVFVTPEVSLQTITGTFDESDNIVANGLVKSVESGASLLSFVFSLNEPPPEKGVIVTVNSDIAGSLDDYFSNLGRSPFSPGGEVLEAVYDETGRATGFRFRIDEPNTILNLYVDGAENVPEQISFVLEDGVGYTVNEDASDATVTFYDTLEQVPEPKVVPEVGFTVSNNNLVESEESETTLTFNLSEPPPEGGVLVYVNSGAEGALGEFDVLNAEIEGGVFPTPNFTSSGFYFKILDTTASITLPAFSDDVTEGRESFTFF